MLFNQKKSPLPSTHNFNKNPNSPTFNLIRPQPSQPDMCAEANEHENLANVDQEDDVLQESASRLSEMPAALQNRNSKVKGDDEKQDNDEEKIQ